MKISSGLRVFGFSVTVFILSSLEAGVVFGANLTPVTPDVVFTCYKSGKPDTACKFGCAADFGYVNPTPLPPGKEPDKKVGGLFLEKVSRLEFYARGKEGRFDTRTWLAYELGTPEGKVVGYFYLSSNLYCNIPNQLDPGVEFRLEVFNQ
jgi:hypothetical protein